MFLFLLQPVTHFTLNSYFSYVLRVIGHRRNNCSGLNDQYLTKNYGKLEQSPKSSSEFLNVLLLPFGHQSSHNLSDSSFDDDSLGNTVLKQPNVPGAECVELLFFSGYFSYSGEYWKYCFGELFLLSEEEEQQCSLILATLL